MTKRSSDEAGLNDDPFASDGSDYDDLEEIGEESDDSDDDLSTFEHDDEFFHAHVLREYPLRPPHATISVDDLRQMIDQHKQAGTLRKFLTSHGATAEMVGYFYEMPKELSENRPRWIHKAKCSVLHCACMDPDEARQKEKIQIIIEAAKRARVDMGRFLASGPVLIRPAMVQPTDEIWAVLDPQDWENVYMSPLRLILANDPETTDSFQLICQECPDVVHAKSSPGRQTKLMFLASECENDVRQALLKIILDAAETTAEGVVGLISAAGEKKAPFDDYDVGTGGATAFHLFAILQRASCLPLLIQKWPDALKHCRELDFVGSPLHEAACMDNGGNHGKRMQCMDALIRGSSLEALSVALVDTNRKGEDGSTPVCLCRHT